MSPGLDAAELLRLVETVFRPRADDRALAVLIDLPDEHLPDRPAWAARRAMAADWCRGLRAAGAGSKLERVDLVAYRNVRRNNAELPSHAAVLRDPDRLPQSFDDLRDPPVAFDELFARYRILIAPTELSATAPLKLAAKRFGFRAATMPGFGPAMVPALRIDYEEVARRCEALKARLDPADGARVELEAAGARHVLNLDLRHRTATASGGRLTEPGPAGNLPSGETYIVPYEGERPGDPSRSEGHLPLELAGELLVYRISRNRIVEVTGNGPRAAAERNEVAREPAYANVAELGLGVLAAFGVRPVGEMLLDEKLGLHVAFGRSDHFGGTVGPADFSAPERVVHIDRVYIPEVQPRVVVRAVDLTRGSATEALIRDGAWV
jgi:leucyl aminopeptidase (aminopeptidase T)